MPVDDLRIVGREQGSDLVERHPLAAQRPRDPERANHQRSFGVSISPSPAANIGMPFLRFHREMRDGTEVNNPKAYLSAVTTRLSIDHLRSARVRRERYVGTWLPEPLMTETEPDAARHAETADSLSMGFLLLLEHLTPVERAVFLLREVFAYGYDEIAEVVGKSEDNCRQIAVRARHHVQEGTPRFEASRERREELT